MWDIENHVLYAFPLLSLTVDARESSVNALQSLLERRAHSVSCHVKSMTVRFPYVDTDEHN